MAYCFLYYLYYSLGSVPYLYSSTFSVSIKRRLISIDFIINTLEIMKKKLDYAVIENLDFRDLIDKYDSENTIFYCDPPYYLKRKYYNENFDENDHLDLYTKLKNIKGKFILSYNYDDFLVNLYKDFYFRKIRYNQNIGVTKNYTDLLIFNYKNNTLLDINTKY